MSNKKSYSYRKDVRTDAEFKRDINSRSKKEKFLVDVFTKELEFRGSTVEMIDNGVDNSGKVIKGNTTTAADYLATIDGEKVELEVKNSPVEHKCTFKVFLLEKYVEAGASILLFYNTGNINYDVTKMDYGKARWAIVSTESIAKMLEDKKDVYYSEPKFGNKICLRIYKKEYDTYFDSESLTYYGE